MALSTTAAAPAASRRRLYPHRAPAAAAAAAAAVGAAWAVASGAFVGSGGLLGRPVPPARSRVALGPKSGKMTEVKPAEMFRVREYQRKSLKKLEWYKQTHKFKEEPRRTRIYAKHPNPALPEKYDLVIPGSVNRLTKRESSLKVKLKREGRADAEDFEQTIQVFAQRARQELKWLSVQRREFIRRAKRWADEMLLQDMKPSLMTLRLLLLGCAAVGDERGASWWLGWMRSQGMKLGRLEFNAVIAAHGAEGLVDGAKSWQKRMEEEGGLGPDARTFAGIMEAYEVVGNRHMMLQSLSDMQDLEAEGKLAESLDDKDYAEPYILLARSYAKVGDAARSLSVLKYLQQKGVPPTLEMHKVRLEAHLRTPRGPRRMPEEIERAFRDVIAFRPAKGPVYTEKLDNLVRGAMGINVYEAILGEFGVSEEQLFVKMPAQEAVNWRKALIQSAAESRAHGMGQIFRKREGRYLAWRKHIEKQEVMGQTAVGYRMAGEKGTPEWMSLKQPVIYGGGPSTIGGRKEKTDRINNWQLKWGEKEKPLPYWEKAEKQEKAKKGRKRVRTQRAFPA